MATGKLGFWLFTGAALTACSAGNGAAHQASSGSHSGDTPSESDDAGPSTTTPDSASPLKQDAGHAADAATADGATGDAATPDGGTTHPADGGADAAPLPFAVTLQNSGRHGADLLFTVQGNDPAGQTSEVNVQLFDGSNAPIVAFDTNWDGIADASQTRLHFDQSAIGQNNFTQTITLPGFFAGTPTIASAKVSLSDANGNSGASLTIALEQQIVVALGAACDSTEVANRCTEGLACTGTPSKCQTTSPPSVKQVAYYGGANPTELFLGSDPAEDLATIRLDFLDANGQSVTIDTSGSGTLASSLALDARSATGQSFFFQNNPVASFAAMVPKLSITPSNSLGQSGTPMIATVATQPLHGNGQACDAYGFTGCSAGTLCSPGTVGATSTCGLVSALQTTKCSAAPPTSTGLLAGWGVVRGVSLWDPPAGCSSATAVSRPESIVTLKLAQPVNTLTLSTAAPETDFDTILYVLPSCATSSTGALGCSDDAPGQGYASTLTLSSVPAGTYLVVVDSAGAQGGHFGLTVKAQ